MKKFTLITLCAFALIVSLADADTVSLNGRDWEVITDIQGGTSYSVNGGGITLTGNWVQEPQAFTEISLGVGDIIEFDFELTKEWMNNSDWIGDAGWHVMNNMTGKTTALRGRWANDINWFHEAVSDQWNEFSAGAGNIVHVFIEFTTATDYVMTLDNGEQNLVVSNPLGNGMSVGDIGVFLLNSWDTQQSATVSDFYAGPQPRPHIWATDPVPGDSAVSVDINADLAWNAPTTIVPLGYELYLRKDDPNFIHSAANILNGVSVDPTETDPVTAVLDALDFTSTYYWRVDAIDPNDGTPTVVEGNVWSFTTVGAAPVIETFDNVRAALSLPDAVISAVVSDADNNVASVSWELLTDDVYNHPGSATVTDTTSNLYSPTATLNTDAAGLFFVKLTVTDGNGSVDKSIAEIRVVETACDLAQLSPTWAGFDPMDGDTDCDVDLADLAVLASKWLGDIGLDSQGSLAGDVSTYPGFGIPNGGFELGTLDAWLSRWWGSGNIIDTPADVHEGTYACQLVNTPESNDGVTLDPIFVTKGSYRLTFWYKGDLSELGVGMDTGQSSAAWNVTYPVDYNWILVHGPVPDYTQFSLEFDVTSAGTIAPYAWSTWGTPAGTGFVDDFRLSKD